MATSIFSLFGEIFVDNDKANKSIDDTTKKGSDMAGKLEKGLAATGKAFAVMGLAAATAFGSISVKALNLGGELEQNLGGAEAVFKEFAGGIEEKGKEAFKNLGLSTSDYLATANKMGALLQGTGFEIEESMDLSSAAMQRAADVASIMGVDTKAAMDAVAGMAKGNYTMMDNLGVAMNDTAIGAYALSKGITTATKDMTQQEKVGLAMEMFLEKTAYAAGNYAKENETLAGSLSTAKAAMTNFLDGSGSVDDLVDAFTNAGDVIIRNIQDIVPRLATGIAEVIQKLTPQIPPLIGALLPSIIEGGAALMTGFVAALPGLVGVVAEALPILIDAVMEMAPKLVDTGAELIVAIINGLTAALPTLIPAAVEIVLSIIMAIIDNLPAILEAGVSMLGALTEGIIDAIPALIDKLPEVIAAIYGFILDNLPMLIEAGIELSVQLAVGMIQAIPQIVAMLPQIISAIFNAFKNVEWAEIGKNIIEGLIHGVKSMASAAVNAVKDIGNSITSGFKKMFGIASRSKLFVKYGGWLMEGLEGGVEENAKGVFAAMDKVGQGLTNILPETLDIGLNTVGNPGARLAAAQSGSAGETGATTGISAAGIVINLMIDKFVNESKQDIRELMSLILEIMEEQRRRREAVYA